MPVHFSPDFNSLAWHLPSLVKNAVNFTLWPTR
eukprot:CAMPEP_0198492648 /NCGR_PEP_ID=MMETSP1462-20131121/3533_1 /TAXON_ID=1333877 /ORGANISM="Brandtodinium nutriculum, Strain RCC3387" /LENGTH=32 /DNA_ID= /DNA_START= /DNA_END= /DNA_ORIENTATION=